jgi:hypothetical protein
MGRPLQNKQADYYQRANADRLGLPLQSRSDGRWQKDMKQIFWDRVEDARKLGSVAIACFAIVIWIGAKASFAFFEEAIFYSLQEWLLSRNQRGQPRRARFKYRAVARPDDVATTR